LFEHVDPEFECVTDTEEGGTLLILHHSYVYVGK